MPDTGYIICTAPRSGSTLLCTLLRATGVAGWPESHFHGPKLADWSSRFDLPQDASIDDIIAAAKTRGCNGGPVFAARQQWHSFPLLMEALSGARAERTDSARLEGALGPLRYISLTRGDKLAQALSLVRAEQSGVWHRNADGSIYERLEPRRSHGYDTAVISARIAEFEDADANWRDWFAAQGVTPLSLTYEALAQDPTGTLRRVLDWIGLDPAHAEGIPAPTQKLADAVTAEWTERFIAETGYPRG